MNAPIHSYNLSKSLPTNIHNLSDLELGAHTALSSGSGARAGAIYYNNFILILTTIARTRRGSYNFITRCDNLTASTTSIRAIHDSGGIYNLLLHPHDERARTRHNLKAGILPNPDLRAWNTLAGARAWMAVASPIYSTNNTSDALEPSAEPSAN